MNKSALTAITRSSLSAPLRVLVDRGLVDRDMRILDYGCGKGGDHRFLTGLGCRASKYDPWFAPECDLTADYDVVLCTYVLNVLGEDVRSEVLRTLKNLSSTKVYATVRRDLKVPYSLSERGTEQYLVKLDEQIVYENSRFCIYSLDGS